MDPNWKFSQGRKKAAVYLAFVKSVGAFFFSLQCVKSSEVYKCARGDFSPNKKG
jgi:hypothetical protein